jgi:hypothetical protein
MNKKNISKDFKSLEEDKGLFSDNYDDMSFNVN